MNEWLTPLCQTHAPEAEGMLGLACAALGALLLAVIVLGFGPLRAWIGLIDTSRDPHCRSFTGEGGLLDIWRLYHALGRARNDTTYLFAPLVPVLIVPADDVPGE